MLLSPLKVCLTRKVFQERQLEVVPTGETTRVQNLVFAGKVAGDSRRFQEAGVDRAVAIKPEAGQ